MEQVLKAPSNRAKMRNSSNQVKVLIWRSQEPDAINVDEFGHVELLIENMCYGFFPDRRENPTALARARGCKGILLARASVAVAVDYLERAAAAEGDEVVLNYRKLNNLPVVWSFTFKASSENMQRLDAFLDSVEREAPLYAAFSRRPGTYNCQTISMRALLVAGIYEGPVLQDPRPDALFDSLSQQIGQYGLVSKERLRLRPPDWI